MIEYVAGDLFKSGATCVVNFVNTVGVMGAGLALQFKQKYPDYFEAYKKACREGLYHPGVPMFQKDSTTNDQLICSFPTKLHWKDLSRVEWIETGLRHLGNLSNTMKLDTVAMGRPGCGLGGLDWDTQVKHLAEQYLGPVPCRFMIYG